MWRSSISSCRRTTSTPVSWSSPRTWIEEPTFDVRGYDYLLLLDVIEHLKSPEQFLERLRAQFDYAPRTLILTTPNIAFGIQRVMLLLGQFNYGKAGILDRTHTRLFTFRSLQQMLVDAGFRIKEMRGVPGAVSKGVGQRLRWAGQRRRSTSC